MLWLPGASAVVINDNGHLLLGRRSDNLLWALISGILEPGEQPADAIVREVFEEAGIRIRAEAVVSLSTDEAVVYPNGDWAQYLNITFLCSVAQGTAFVADDENVEFGWFPPDALPVDLVPTSRTRIERTLEFLLEPGAGPWYSVG
jgi:8-oxo-dGTP pyrophosphatase MutT (NUDIX family)